MQIKTKFDIGDEVWLISKNFTSQELKYVKAKITNLQIIVSDNNPIIQYDTTFGYWVTEDEVFESKEKIKERIRETFNKLIEHEDIFYIHPLYKIYNN